MKASHRLKTVLGALGALILASPVQLRADDVTDELDTARAAYDDGNVSAAIQALDLARQLMMEKTASALAKLFPEFEGMVRGEPESSAAGQAMFGGMVTAECNYTAKKGDGSLTAKYTTKSPMLQTVMMMFNMPGMSGASGMKVERIAGKRALVERSGNSGKVQIVYESEMLVEIEFTDLDYEKVKAFFAVIPWNDLNAML